MAKGGAALAPINAAVIDTAEAQCTEKSDDGLSVTYVACTGADLAAQVAAAEADIKSGLLRVDINESQPPARRPSTARPRVRPSAVGPADRSTPGPIDPGLPGAEAGLPPSGSGASPSASGTSSPTTHIDLDVARGEVHALLGENGAGKTTLMRILYGLTRPDAGAIEVGGRPVAIRSPRDAIAAGIGMVTQHFSLVRPMTVAENVALGRVERRAARPRCGPGSRRARSARRFGIAVDPDARHRGPVGRASSSASRSSRRSPATAACSSSTSRRRCSCRRRSTPCSRPSGAWSPTGSRSSSSATSWARCARSPTASACSAPASSSGARPAPPTSASWPG